MTLIVLGNNVENNHQILSFSEAKSPATGYVKVGRVTLPVGM